MGVVFWGFALGMLGLMWYWGLFTHGVAVFIGMLIGLWLALDQQDDHYDRRDAQDL